LPTIRFTKHPAYVTVTDGVSMAATYWRASWALWILPVAAIVLVNGLAEFVFGNAKLDSTMFSGGTFGRPFTVPKLTPAQIAGPLATGLVGLVANWFLTAIAVAGLRNRPVTAAWVVVGGLRTIIMSLLAGLAFGLVFAVFIALFVLSPIFLLALLVAVPVGLYIYLRLAFWNVAVFDDLGVIDAARFSWRITEGSILRLLGWGLVDLVIMLAVSLLAIVPTFILSFTGITPVGTMVATGMTEACAAFSLMLLAVLYESQRWRYAPPPAAVAAGMPYPAADQDGPLEPPPPPPPASPWG
jgi:hypothetical protein